MDFAVAHELRMLRDTVRRFVQQELMPLEREYAEAPDIPDALRAELQD
jgi:acyl-CoA dehydrogenase